MHAPHPADIEGRIYVVPSEPLRQRKAERVRTSIAAGLRSRGVSSVDARVLELSTHGFRASVQAELAPEMEVRLRLPGLEPWSARIVWVMDFLIGGEFERPLHPAVLATILRRAA